MWLLAALSIRNTSRHEHKAHSFRQLKLVLPLSVPPHPSHLSALLLLLLLLSLLELAVSLLRPLLLTVLGSLRPLLLLLRRRAVSALGGYTGRGAAVRPVPRRDPVELLLLLTQLVGGETRRGRGRRPALGRLTVLPEPERSHGHTEVRYTGYGPLGGQHVHREN